jgi:pyruvate kinase
MHRTRKAKIVATLGPATADLEGIRALFNAGADVFRLNFSHGTHADHKERVAMLRRIERESGRPVGILLDLQGPKLRVGTFANGPVQLEAGQSFQLDLDADRPGDASRVSLPHPEIFAALSAGSRLLLDDGKICLNVTRCDGKSASTEVLVGGPLSDRKGVNVPDVVLPLSAMTEKDHADLEFGLKLEVDWVALSFVQRPEDIEDIKKIIAGRAGVVAKLEKPSAIAHLDAIVEASDAIMVARGDLGVEMPAEQVPSIQKRIVRQCRKTGRPVIVATQMLDSMVAAPVPTRAEASDVATAIYDGADAVMLSAESASGRYPVEAVAIMDRIIHQTEADPYYREAIDASRATPGAESADAIGRALSAVTGILGAQVTVAYTTTGHSALCMARERPMAPIIGMTPRLTTARRLALVWGIHASLTHDVADVGEMTDFACRTALTEGFAAAGDTVVISAGLPFGTPGATNLLRIAKVE